MSLRSNLIRLAHENPDVRRYILPLLKEAALPPARTWLETQLGNVFTSESAGHEFWFIPLSVTKSNTAKGLLVTIVWSESSKPSKAKNSSLPERDLSGSHWKVVPAGGVPDPVRARFQEAGVRVASVGHFAAITQPKGMKPTYDGNVMAVPLDWGTNGVMEPYYVARAMLPLFRAAENGVAFVLDPRGVFSKPGLPAVAKALKIAISDQYGESHAMATEYHEDAPAGSPGDRAIKESARRARIADKVTVSITPVSSPKTGMSGIKVTFRPTVKEVEDS